MPYPPQLQFLFQLHNRYFYEAAGRQGTFLWPTDGVVIHHEPNHREDVASELSISQILGDATDPRILIYITYKNPRLQ